MLVNEGHHLVTIVAANIWTNVGSGMVVEDGVQHLFPVSERQVAQVFVRVEHIEGDERSWHGLRKRHNDCWLLLSISLTCSLKRGDAVIEYDDLSIQDCLDVGELGKGSSRDLGITASDVYPVAIGESD